MNAHILLGSALWLLQGTAPAPAPRPSMLVPAPVEASFLRPREKARLLLHTLPPVQRLTDDIEATLRHPSRESS